MFNLSIKVSLNNIFILSFQHFESFLLLSPLEHLLCHGNSLLQIRSFKFFYNGFENRWYIKVLGTFFKALSALDALGCNFEFIQLSIQELFHILPALYKPGR